MHFRTRMLARQSARLQLTKLQNCTYRPTTMQDLLTPHQIEAHATAAGLSMAEVCRRAQVATSTFSRWKSGKTEPTLDVYRRLRNAALKEAPAEAA
tara:strand:+ start:439 stop:726 length:288 start_codon:yes stop_codon:yes gene_type:complete